MEQVSKLIQWLSTDAVKRLLRMVVIAGLCEAGIFIFLYSPLNLPIPQSLDRLFVLFMLMLILYVIMTRRVNKYLFELVENYIARLRLRVMDRVRHTELPSFERMGQEPIYTALTFDVKAISEVSHTLASLVQAGIWTIVMLLYLAFLSWQGFFLTIGMIGLAALFYGFNQFRIRRVIDAVREQEHLLLTAFGHLLDGFKELKLSDRKNDDFFRRGLMWHAAELRKLKLQADRLLINNYTLSYILWEALIIMIVSILPLFGIFSHNLLLTFVGIILYLPISVLIEHFPRIFLASISIQRLFRFEQTAEELVPETIQILPESDYVVFEELLYQDLRFTYHENGQRPFALGPLTLTLKAGESVFITGGNGSGKSTLLKVLTGLYPLQSGQVLLNRQVVSIAQHRYLFSAVFSDYHLFDRLYGLEQVDPERVRSLLVLMQLETKVRFEEGQFTMHDLSTGQKKRLALLSAMLEEKPIYMFDEWAAGQDPHFRNYFYLTLLPMLKAQGKTVIAVTHDDRYFHVADRVVKMEYGQFTED